VEIPREITTGLNHMWKNKERETKSLYIETKIITTSGDNVSVGGKETYLKLLTEAKKIVEQAFGESTKEWLDMNAIPTTAEGGTAIFCKDTEGKLIGFIHGRPESLINGPEGRGKWVLSVLAAYPPGQGTGGVLIESLKKSAKDHGANVVFARTDPERTETIKFYQAHGFVSAGRVEGYYEYTTGRAPAIWLMAKL